MKRQFIFINVVYIIILKLTEGCHNSLKQLGETNDEY